MLLFSIILSTGKSNDIQGTNLIPNNTEIPITDFGGASSGNFRVEVNLFSNVYNTTAKVVVLVDLNQDNLEISEYKHFGQIEYPLVRRNKTTFRTESNAYSDIELRLKNGLLLVKQYAAPVDGGLIKLLPSRWEVWAGETLPLDQEYISWTKKDQIPPIEKEEKNTPYISANQPALGSAASNAIHRGYNVRKMDPLFLSINPGVKSDCFIFKKPSDNTKRWHTSDSNFRLPFHISISGRSSGQEVTESQTSVFFTSAQRAKTFESSLELPVGYSHSSSNTEGSMEENSEVSAISTRWIAGNWLVLDKRYVELDPNFINAVLRLHGKGQADYFTFFENYGTHYPLSVLLGGLQFTQRYFTAEQTAAMIQDSWNEEYKEEVSVEIKGIGKTFTTASGSGRSESRSVASGDSLDTEGSIHYGNLTSAGLDAEPIKADLRPITELINRTLMRVKTSKGINRLASIRNEMIKHYQAYIDQSIASPDRKPRSYELKIRSITLIEEDDDITDPAPELFGHIYIMGYRGAEKKAETNVWSVSVNDRVTTKKNERLNIGPSRSQIVIVPKLVKEGNNWEDDYELDQYYFRLHVGIADHDGGSKNDRVGRHFDFELADLRGEAGKIPAPITGNHDVAWDGGGTIRINYAFSLSAGKYTPLDLKTPDFPNYAD